MRLFERLYSMVMFKIFPWKGFTKSSYTNVVIFVPGNILVDI